jgi:glycosyltransferase involved in cell wall biosynthesis
MKILVVTSGMPFVRDSAEILAENLTAALNAAGRQAEHISIPFQPSPPDRIPNQILACRLLDVTESCGARIDRIIALNFPAYLIPHPHKLIWMIHQHRPAYELWDDPAAGELIRSPDGPVIREAIRRADRELIPQAKATYTVSKNVTRRLGQFCGIAARPVYHPPAHAELFHAGSTEDYFFFPGRITSLKRQLLVIQAMDKCRERTRVRFAGPDHSTEMAAYTETVRQLRLEDRVEWLGWVSEEKKRDLYAHSLGVLFPPRDADYGYVTLEAMLSAKPVITCGDSGAPLEFVVDGRTGLVAEATADSLAQAMDNLWADRRCAAALGEAGRAHYQDLGISWDGAVEKLTC